MGSSESPLSTLERLDICVEKIVIRHLTMPLVEEFKMSFGSTKIRHSLLIELHGDGLVGYGECPAGEGPFYSYEACETAVWVLKKYLARKIIGKTYADPQEFRESMEFVRGHRMAKAALEYAFWDLYAKELGMPLWRVYGGVKKKIPVGVSIGIRENPRELLRVVARFVEKGYRRIKIKIAPGRDIIFIRAIREEFPEVPLQVDANAAYRLSDVEIFKEMDKYDLLMIEQPLHYEDLLDHAHLQSYINTPICLDESIVSEHDARLAIKLGSCKIINVKPPRVGGIIEAIKICRIAAQHGLGLWIGGMLETGIGKTHLLHIASLSSVNYPSDISESSRYWEEDIIDKPLKLRRDGTIEVPDGAGIGVELLMDKAEKYQTGRWTIRRI